MRKIRLFIACSLDGYIAKEDGSVDWLPQNGDSGYEQFYKSIDTVLMGKKTYDQILTFGKYPYKDKLSYVFTRNPNQKKDENVEFISEVEEFTQKLISNSGKDIWLVGGSDTASTFLNLKFVDELIISVIPVVLGKGIPLFTNIKEEIKLELVKTTKYSKLVELSYKIL
ncbi:MAG TPA: dihydrofolate reductase family protein [Nitrosopumilaceae archaeon]|nr:dihydrofolate reductase family protein [Nitrosopumilaceae archaeon]